MEQIARYKARNVCLALQQALIPAKFPAELPSLLPRAPEAPQTIPLQQAWLMPTQSQESAVVCAAILTETSADSDSEEELATDSILFLSEEDKLLREALEEESRRLWHEQVLEVASGLTARRLREVWSSWRSCVWAGAQSEILRSIVCRLEARMLLSVWRLRKSGPCQPQLCQPVQAPASAGSAAVLGLVVRGSEPATRLAAPAPALPQPASSVRRSARASAVAQARSLEKSVDAVTQVGVTAQRVPFVQVDDSPLLQHLIESLSLAPPPSSPPRPGRSRLLDHGRGPPRCLWS